jgi:PAS domain S-box-containing protein
MCANRLLHQQAHSRNWDIMTKLTSPEQWLRLLAERSEQIYTVMSLDPPEMCYIGPAFEKIWKMPVGEMMGDPQVWINTIVAEDRDRVAQLFSELIDGVVDRYDISYRIVDGHGSVRWIRDTGYVVVNPMGGGRVVVGVAEDSTALHRSEHTLRQRIDWFELLTQQSPIVLWATDRKLRFTASTGAGLKAIGTEQNRVVGMSLFEYFNTSDVTFLPIKAHLDALKGTSSEYEIPVTERIFTAQVRPFHDSTGEIIGVVGAAFDITDYRKAEAAIQESTETYRTLIEKNPELVALIVDGKLAYVNDSLRRVTGYEPAEMIGRSPVEFVIPEDRALAGERIRAVMSGDTPRPTSYRTIRKDGVLRNIEVLAQRISYRGQPALVAFIHDITERKQTEDEMRRHGLELERLVEERTSQIHELVEQRAETEKLAATGRMAARVAHEINNPLAGIKSAFHLIRDAVTPEHPHYNYVGLIDREIDRIANIVQLMYRLYRPGQLQWSPVDIGSCIRDVVSLIALTADRRGVRIQISEDGCPRVQMPAGHLEQILFNLIQNALEASPGHGIVSITAGPGPTGAVICVSDRGPGVPDSLRNLIFEPFFTTKTEGNPAGLGLGLSVTRSLAESIGGRIEYSDRPGGGAIFTVVLPGED